MLTKDYNKRLFHENTLGLDVAVVEGVMGLFDGYDGLSEAGSTAEMAKCLKLPVVLVVSAKGKARSAAAIVKGFEDFDKDLTLAGVIFSKTGSLRHYEYLKKAVEQNCRTRCLGHMPKDDSIVMPERHLGLVTADEQVLDSNALSRLSSMVRDNIDMEILINSLESFNIPQKRENKDAPAHSHGTGPTIAVARDKAFCFYYPDNFNIFKKFGAKIIVCRQIVGKKRAVKANPGTQHKRYAHLRGMRRVYVSLQEFVCYGWDSVLSHGRMF